MCEKMEEFETEKFHYKHETEAAAVAATATTTTTTSATTTMARSTVSSTDSSGSLTSLWNRVGPYVVLLLCLFASGFTFIASWSCNTFFGAEMPWFVGGGYGIWSLEDSQHNCQLWSVLFFAYNLDAPLRVARFCSMLAMLLSLLAIATLTQVTPFGRIGSWLVAIALIYWLADSLTYWWRFNIWATFFILTYSVMVLTMRCVVLKKYSKAILWTFGCRLFLVCCASSCGIFFILASTVCTCEQLSEEDLEAVIEVFARPEECSGQCVLGPTSQTAIATPLLWLSGYVMACFVSVEEHPQWSDELSPPRPRLGTATTFAAADENEDDDDDDDDDDACRGPEDTPQGKEQELYLQRQREQGEQQCSIAGVDFLTRQQVSSHSEAEPMHKETELYGTTERSTCKLLDDDDDNALSNGEDEDITPVNTRRRVCYRRIGHTILALVTFAYLFIDVVLLGSYFEDRNAAKAPDTSYNFIVDEVCAFHPLDPTLPFETFETKAAAKQAGYVVAHCGACGQCSNPYDIQKYVDTRKTVAQSAKKCSVEAIFGKDNELLDCLEDAIGFSRDCTVCWAENMRTTAKHCMWTCLSSMLVGLMKSNNVEGADDYDWLNQCIFCDEKRSGPNFVTCSGVARRRLGIQSEIERNPKEQCANVEFDYVTANLSMVFPQPWGAELQDESNTTIGN